MSTVLAIAPHPDDELIGAGGSLIKHALAGNRVVAVQVIGRERTLGDERPDEEYTAEIDLARKRLGVQECINLGAPSRDLHAERRWRLELAAVLRRERPDVVYLPHAGEADVEHQIVHALARDAIWMANANFFPAAGPEPCPLPSLVLAYEVWTPMSQFSYVEDIGGTIDAKVHAMRAYESQLRHVPWDAAIEGLARYRGAVAQSGGFAEVFEVLRSARPAVMT